MPFPGGGMARRSQLGNRPPPPAAEESRVQRLVQGSSDLLVSIWAGFLCCCKSRVLALAMCMAY